MVGYSKGQCRNFFSIELQVCTFKVNPVTSFREAILLLSQYSFNLGNRFLKVVRARKTTILLVYYKIDLRRIIMLTDQASCSIAPVKRRGMYPTVDVKYYHSQQGSGHSDFSTPSYIKRSPS